VYVNILSLLGLHFIHRRLVEIVPKVERLTGQDARKPFDRVGMSAGPLLLSMLQSILWAWPYHVSGSGQIPIHLLVFQFVGWMPGNTALWVVISILLELDRLGRRPLHLLPFEEDRSLGLRPLGSLAFAAFLLFTAALVPLAAARTDDVYGLGILLLQYLLGVGVFFLSLLRLRLQLLRAKSEYAKEATRLYADAFKGMGQRWTLGALEKEGALLSAAEAVERRVATIQEWPFDHSLFTRIAAIVTGVTATIVARLIMGRLGM
jgi:hypothetical protein